MRPDWNQIQGSWSLVRLSSCPSNLQGLSFSIPWKSHFFFILFFVFPKSISSNPYIVKKKIYISLCFVKIHLPSLLHVSLFTIILCLSLIHFYSISLPLCIRFSLSFRVFLIFLVLSSYSYIILDLFFIFFIFFIFVLAFIFLFPQ